MRRVKNLSYSFHSRKFYYSLPHVTSKSVLSAMLGHQLGIVNKIMGAYQGVPVLTHKKGPPPIDGSRPPDIDLIGPHLFKCRLSLQCGMTPAISVMLIHMLLLMARTTSPSKIFIFLHALIFASSKGGEIFKQVVTGIASFLPAQFNCKKSIGSWCISGKECIPPRVDGIATEHIGCNQFMEMVLKQGCSWYPLFSILLGGLNIEQ